MDSQLFGAYAFYSALLAAKWLVMSFWTAKQRFGEKVKPKCCLPKLVLLETNGKTQICLRYTTREINKKQCQ